MAVFPLAGTKFKFKEVSEMPAEVYMGSEDLKFVSNNENLIGLSVSTYEGNLTVTYGKMEGDEYVQFNACENNVWTNEAYKLFTITKYTDWTDVPPSGERLFAQDLLTVAKVNRDENPIGAIKIGSTQHALKADELTEDANIFSINGNKIIGDGNIDLVDVQELGGFANYKHLISAAENDGFGYYDIWGYSDVSASFWGDGTDLTVLLNKFVQTEAEIPEDYSVDNFDGGVIKVTEGATWPQYTTQYEIIGYNDISSQFSADAGTVYQLISSAEDGFDALYVTKDDTAHGLTRDIYAASNNPTGQASKFVSYIATVENFDPVQIDPQFIGNLPMSSITGLEEIIPEAASAENELADKNFVNSSIATSTGTFKGTFNSVAELPTTGVATNDYAFVIRTDSEGNTIYDRYKYNGSQWLFEYSLNNSSFTAVQWAAINSGITSTGATILSNSVTNNGIGYDVEGEAHQIALKYIPTLPTSKISTLDTKISAYDSHIASTSNPHSVTATQARAVSFEVNQQLSETAKTMGRNNIDAQLVLESGSNIKTINGQSVLGSGNITIESGTKKYAAANPALTASSGVCTWTIAAATHAIGNQDLIVQVYENSTRKQVIPEIAVDSSGSITIEFVSSSNISAGSYKVIVIG